MHIVSEIFMNLRHCLKDNYLSGDQDIGGSEALKQYQALKQSISDYMENVVMPSTDNKNNVINDPELEELDHNFTANYEEW
jgi:hypothetical protein